MLKRENFPDQRKYSTLSRNFTSETTSLQRATDILKCLCDDINTVTEITDFLGYTTSTVHRLLQNLKKLGWVTQDTHNHKYYLGPLVTVLSTNNTSTHKYLIMHSLREMTRLSGVTEETISLVVMVQLHHILLHEITSTYTLKITQENDASSPFYLGAVAKVLLSQLDDKELKTTLKHVKPSESSSGGVTDKGTLFALLKEIRQKGYCVTCGERTPGGMCISTPIKNYMCPATLNIIGPEERLKPKVNKFVRELQASTTRISKDIALASDKRR